MSFLNAIFLWGALAASIPLVIHLFSRKKKVIIPWGAMQFLMEKPPRRKAKFLKLNELLILLLRILAILLLALAFARPLVSFFSGGKAPRDIVFIIDASLSSSLPTNEGPSTFERQKELAIETIESLSSTDYLRILVTSNKQNWITGSPILTGGANKQSLIEQISNLKPTLGEADFPQALREALSLAPAKDNLARQIVIFADGTTHGWNADDPTVWTATNRFINDSSFPAHIEVILARETLPKIDNLVLEDVNLERETVAPRAPMTANATIRNSSTYPSPTRSLVWTLSEDIIAEHTIPALSPGQATTLTHQFTAPNAGVFPLTCQIEEEDALTPDNTSSIVFEVLDEISVLIVDGSFDGSKNTYHESGFFLSSLGHTPAEKQVPESPSIFQPKVISTDLIDQEDLNSYHCVVLANTKALTPADSTLLEDFVRNGGGLWIALGDQVSPSEYNVHMSGKDSQLIPMNLLGASTPLPEESSIAVRPPLAKNSPLHLLGDLERLDTDRIRITQYHQLETPLPADIATHLSIEGGSPLITEHSLGSGKVIISTLPLNRDWSNIPLTQSYVVITHELIWHLLEPHLIRRNISAGTPFSWQPIEQLIGTTATITQPDSSTEFKKITSTPFNITDTTDPGLYQISSSRMRDLNQEQFFSISRNQKESTTTLLTDQQINMLINDGGLTFVSKALSSTPKSIAEATPRNPAWSFLLLLLLGFFLLEVFVAQRLLKLRRSSHSPATMAPQQG